jgi:hypothetical protein
MFRLRFVAIIGEPVLYRHVSIIQVHYNVSVRCPETYVNNYHKTPRNIPEERRSQHRGGSLKSRFLHSSSICSLSIHLIRNCQFLIPSSCDFTHSFAISCNSKYFHIKFLKVCRLNLRPYVAVRVQT